MSEDLKNPIPANTDQRQLFKLSQESIGRIKKASEEIPKVRKALDDLKRLGLDVSILEEKLAWSERARDILMANVIPDSEQEK